MLVCNCLQGRTRGLHRCKRGRSIGCYRLVACTRPDQHICVRCRRSEGICGRRGRLRSLRAVHNLNVAVCRSRLRFVLTRGVDRRKGIVVGVPGRRRIGAPFRREIDYGRVVSFLGALGGREGRLATKGGNFRSRIARNRSAAGGGRAVAGAWTPCRRWSPRGPKYAEGRHFRYDAGRQGSHSESLAAPRTPLLAGSRSRPQDPGIWSCRLREGRVQ
jgi:hypothetical protein